MDAEQAYALSRKYTKDSVMGMGALKGDKGEKGDKGDKGDRGDVGATGAAGPQGAQGIQGAKGEKGDKGDTGATGATGPQGIQGIQGVKGDKGDAGYPFLIYKQYDTIVEFDEEDFPEIGLMFMVMTMEVDPQTEQNLGYPVYRYTGDGNPPYSFIMYLNTSGIKGDKGDKGDTGEQGIQGVKGDTGEKGDKGDKGDTGDTGAQGIQGIQGIQGDTGRGIYSVKTEEVSGAAHLFIKYDDDLNTWIDCGAIDVDIPLATINSAGKVKPDGMTVNIDQYGTISAVQSEQVSQQKALDDWQAVFGNEGVIESNLITASATVFNSSDVTVDSL